jgi:hypothetical protein
VLTATNPDASSPATPPASIGTVDGLAQWLGVTFDTAEQAQADMALAAASGAVRDLTSQFLSYVADDTLLMDWNGDQSLFLPELPVVDVVNVEALQTLGDPLSWSDWPTDQLQWSMRTGELVLACEPWAGWPSGGWPAWLAGFPGRALQGIRVTYSHGFNPMPPELVGVTYGMASRMLDAPTGQALSGETIGAYAYTMSSSALAGGGWAAGLTGPEAAIIARYRIANRA